MYFDAGLKEAELAFLNAPFDADGWRSAMHALSSATRTTFAQFVGIGGPLLVPFNVLNVYPNDPNGHMNNMDLLGPGNWRIGTTDAAMAIRHEHHYAQYRAERGATDYDDAMSDLDFVHGCHSALMLESSGTTRLALLRTRRDGPCDADVLQRFGWLSRQAERAMRVQLALGEESAQLMLGGLEGIGEATLLLDRTGQICGVSEAAETLLDQANEIEEDGFALRLSNTAEDRALGAALKRLMSGEGVQGPVLHDMIVGRSANYPDGRWRLLCARLPAMEHGFGFQPAVALTFRPHHA